FTLVRSLAGARAALIAAAFLGFHYAADVPVLWVSGSQDLLAVMLALGCLALDRAGRRAWAALALMLALLAKESVCLTPLIAVLAGARPGEPWRRALARAWPLVAVTALWAVAWLVTVALGRGGPG